MTERSRAQLCEEFEISLLICLKELDDLMPELDRRYGTRIILHAMAEHVGRGLRILLNRNICDDAQAQSLIRQIAATALQEPRPPSRH
ncbi:MAG TPA: hypothetical protein VHB68_04880 [Steroidobacteraceae bacterium]|nr:hypothetical protein [Steroidobacteraceae bacterium]